MVPQSPIFDKILSLSPLRKLIISIYMGFYHKCLYWGDYLYTAPQLGPVGPSCHRTWLQEPGSALLVLTFARQPQKKMKKYITK